MNDVECPYCNEWQEINHDDGYGYTEDEVFQQECSNCEQIFTYTTSVIYSYSSYKAPCQNGGEHKLEGIHGYPKEFFKYKKRCEYCDEEIIIDEDLHKKEIEKYFEELKQEE